MFEMENKMKLTKEQYQQFLNMSSQLSPENLHCDGEISNSEAGRRYRAIMSKWHKLEKEVGRKVTEDEIWKIHLETWSKQPIDKPFKRRVPEKYQVTLTRDATESVNVTVVADSLEEATEMVQERAGKYGSNISGWELDEGNMHEVYVTSAEKITNYNEEKV